ncbi:unnamed protein product [Brassica rapa subsp. trilocularis]
MIPARNSASRSHEVNNGRRREAFSRYLEQRERGSPRNYNTSSKGAKPGASSPSAWALSPGRVSTMKTSSSSSAPSTSMCHTPPESPVSKAKMRSGGGGAVAGVLKIYKMRKYVVENLIEVQRLRQEIKLRQVLSLQMPLLNEWSKLEAKNCEALSKLTRKLQALSARSPLLHGATVDVVSIHEEMVRAIEVMDEIEDFVIKFLPRQVEIILYEMTELLNMSKQELLYFEELVKSIFLVPVFAANESSLKVHFLQKIEEQRRHLQQIDNSGFSSISEVGMFN